MNIVIVGGGTVGTEICERLAPENHNITIIDTNEITLTELSNKYDLFGIVGNGAELSVLKKADPDKADLLIAVTSNDEINILCCATAKKLGVENTIARVRNPEYAEMIEFMRDEFDLSMTINPELALAKEIYRTLKFPSANRIDTFCKGRVEIAELVVPTDSPICHKSLIELRSSLKMRFIVCAVLRGNEAHIPTGNFVIEAGDTICVTLPDEEISKFFKAIGAYKHPVRNILVVGAGRITYYLESLLKGGKMHSTVIDKNRQRCLDLASNYSATVVCDTPTKQEVLLEEGLAAADAFLALSDNDEDNAIVSMYAKKQSAGKIVTKINSSSYAELFKGLGLDGIVSPKSSTASLILKQVRSLANVKGSEIENLYKLMNGKVEALEFFIKENIKGLTDIPLKELKLKSGILLACIIRDGNVIVPTGSDTIMTGDTVIVVTTTPQITGIRETLK